MATLSVPEKHGMYVFALRGNGRAIRDGGARAAGIHRALVIFKRRIDAAWEQAAEEGAVVVDLGCGSLTSPRGVAYSDIR